MNNKIITILLIFIVIGLFTIGFMLGEIKSEMNKNNTAVMNDTANKTNETVNTTLINSTIDDSENTTSEPVKEEEEKETFDNADGIGLSDDDYSRQREAKFAKEAQGETLNDDYVESTGGLEGKELQEYMENNVPDDYK